MFNTFYCSELSYQGLQLWGVVEHDRKVAAEKAIVRVDTDATHDNFLFFWDDARDVVDDTDIVVANNMESNGVLWGPFTAPFSFYNSVTESFAELGSIWTVGAMNLYPTIDGNKAKDIVAIDGVTTLSQLIINTLEVAVNIPVAITTP